MSFILFLSACADLGGRLGRRGVVGALAVVVTVTACALLGGLKRIAGGVIVAAEVVALFHSDGGAPYYLGGLHSVRLKNSRDPLGFRLW